MFRLRKPSASAVRRYIADQSRLDLTYADVGATARTPTPGFVVDHTRVRLGQGEATFDAAVAALRRWEHFSLGWTSLDPPDTPFEPGRVVSVLARVFGVWSLNACRIVYAVDEDGPVRRVGFAYGTLPGHVESGEERFVVEWDRGDDSVWYDIVAMSRPRHPLARLGYPVVRRLQKRFGRDSAAAMVRASSR